MLRLPDRWVWDFWHVADGETHHLFFLQADRALGRPALRHWNVTIGHAVSTDLCDWAVLPDALAPADGPAWDDYTTWTGNVVSDGGQWHLMYTGTSHAERGLVQRIGRAVSTDLTTWHRAGDGPAFELDERWYDPLDESMWHDQAWRDPVLVHHHGTWNALVTARLRHGPAHERGTIGLATSLDLATWTVRPPLTGPTPFGHLEIPDVVAIGRHWFLFFASSHPIAGGTAPSTNAVKTGTFAVPSLDGPLGPWAWDRLHMALGDGWYGAKVIERLPRSAVRTDPELVALAWRAGSGDEDFGGWISDPMPVRCDDDVVTVTPPASEST